MSTEPTSSKEQFWQTHFIAWEASGLSQIEYCKQHDLKPSNFAYWRTRANKKRRKFMPLSPPVTSDHLVLGIPHGIRLELPAHALAEVLPTVLRALRESA